MTTSIEEFMDTPRLLIASGFDELERREPIPSTLDDWMRRWTVLESFIEEAYARLHLATSADTGDEDAARRYHEYIDHTYLPAASRSQGLKKKLLNSGLVPADFVRPYKTMKQEFELFREENLPLLAEEERLGSQYDKIIGSQTVEWRGEELTIQQVESLLQEGERGLRESAWLLTARRWLDDRREINDLWLRFLALRLSLAKNAGFENYRSFRWRTLARFDYGRRDCRCFHEAIERVVVPAARRIHERRARRLGLASLRPWDLSVDPLGRPPLRPFADADTLINVCEVIFNRVDKELGELFTRLRLEKLLDLDNRKGKAPGGFCTFFPVQGRPYIFMNAVGMHRDVKTLIHESGHAFHFEAMRAIPYHQQRQPAMEFAEVASIAMELLASPFLSETEGGFYSDGDAARARVEHLESIILFWPYMSVVDSFQHWVYENPHDASHPSACDAAWSALWDRFMPGVDWEGLEDFKSTGWHRKLHIHRLPFYYFEYGIAQLGAVQIWRNSLRDSAGAIASYKSALALGDRPLPQLFQAAGATFSFDVRFLAEAVELIENTIEGLLAA